MSRSMKIPSVFFFFFLFVREEKFVKFNNRDISTIFTIFLVVSNYSFLDRALVIVFGLI